MAAKRFFDESCSDQDPSQNHDKRRRTTPSLASVVGEVLTMNFLDNFCSALEPMLRRVVNEEVEDGLRRGMRSITRSPSLRIEAIERSTLQLRFSEKLSLPIFTGSKVLGLGNGPLQILLVDKKGDQSVPAAHLYSIKVEIVVLDGDFPSGGRETWTSEEFEKNIVRERTGKRPLLTGDVNVTMRNGFSHIGDLDFTDNSSWIRSRKFRIGARVVQGTLQGVKIQEAMTEAFVVKDHRGELYKKHHPPMLEDEVWRLEKIGKEGAFHRKLAAEGINTVQDFLKLSIVDLSKLRKVLGVGMSEKMWEVTLKHARTCMMGTKLYISHGPNHTIILNPICQVVRAVINRHTYTEPDLTRLHRAYIESLIRDAYVNWNSLQEVDGSLSETPLLTQGDLVDQYSNQTTIRPFQQRAFLTEEPVGVTSMPINDWVVSSAFICTPSDGGAGCTFSESSSEGDLTPAKLFFHDN